MKVKRDKIGLYVTKRIKQKPKRFYAPKETKSGVGKNVMVKSNGYKPPSNGILNRFFKKPSSITVFVNMKDGADLQERWSANELETSWGREGKAYMGMSKRGVRRKSLMRYPSDLVWEQRDAYLFLWRWYGLRKNRDWSLAMERKIPASEHKTIYQRRLNGETLQNIANDYGVGRERIRQLVRVYANKRK